MIIHSSVKRKGLVLIKYSRYVGNRKEFNDRIISWVMYSAEGQKVRLKNCRIRTS